MFQSDSIFYLKFYASSHQPKVYNQSALQMIWHGFNMASTSSPIPLYYGNWQNILGAAISPRRRPQLWHLLSLARYVSFKPKYIHNLTQSCHLVWLNFKPHNIFEMANIWGARGNNFRIWFNGQDFSANTASYPTQKINLTQRNLNGFLNCQVGCLHVRSWSILVADRNTSAQSAWFSHNTAHFKAFDLPTFHLSNIEMFQICFVSIICRYQVYIF